MADYPITFYWAILFFSFFLFILNIISNDKKLDYLAIILLVAIIFFSITREYISSDYVSYKYAYEKGFDSDYALIFEPGWTILTTFLQSILGFSFEYFIALLFLIVFYLKFQSYRAKGINPSIFLYFYITNYWLLFDIGALRRSLALSICIYCMLLVNTGKLRIFLFSLATTFHITGIIGLLLFYSKNFFDNLSYRNYLILLSCFTILMPLFLNILLNFTPIQDWDRLLALQSTEHGESLSILKIGLLMRIILIICIFSSLSLRSSLPKWILYSYFLYIPFFVTGSIISSLAFLSFYPRIFEPFIFIKILKFHAIDKHFIVPFAKLLVLLMLISMSSMFFDQKFMFEYIYKQY